MLLQTAGDRGSLFLYKEDVTLATIEAANYMDKALGVPTQLRDGDAIIIIGSDGITLAKVTVEEGAVTLVTV